MPKLEGKIWFLAKIQFFTLFYAFLKLSYFKICKKAEKGKRLIFSKKMF